MAMEQGWQDFLREQFVIGSRVRVRELAVSNPHIAQGAEGTLAEIDDTGGFHVRFDNGISANLRIGADRFLVEPPQPHTLKLYMPLTADFYEPDEYGDTNEEPTELSGESLTAYADKIVAALVRERTDEEAERGIMHWYHKDDGVDRKVRSVLFTAEKRNNRLWGVAECRVAGELEPEEMKTLKDYVTGQASDGWGEGFEQRTIKIDSDSELYVHLWNYDKSWSLQTEEERFGPAYAEGLPEMCFSTLNTTGELICIKRGESGYYPSDWNTSDKERNRQIADDANEARGITKAQEQAMVAGSMFGWHVPAADPAFHETQGPQEEQMGGMTLG